MIQKKTIKVKECNSTKQEIKNISSHNNEESQNIVDTEKCNKPEESENKEIIEESTASKTTDTAPLTNQSVTQDQNELKTKESVTQDPTVLDDTTVKTNDKTDTKVKEKKKTRNQETKGKEPAQNKTTHREKETSKGEKENRYC